MQGHGSLHQIEGRYSRSFRETGGSPNEQESVGDTSDGEAQEAVLGRARKGMGCICILTTTTESGLWKSLVGKGWWVVVLNSSEGRNMRAEARMVGKAPVIEMGCVFLECLSVVGQVSSVTRRIIVSSLLLILMILVSLWMCLVC